MPGGYLRVMYPEPEMCLDLSAWQEFCGFDKTGCNFDIDIDINSNDLTMDIVVKSPLPEVMSDKKVSTDYFGNAVGEKRIAGPFAELKGDRIRLNIDPRKLDGK
jgi:hypothetical protein